MDGQAEEVDGAQAEGEIIAYRVLLAEDHPIMAEAVASRLARDGRMTVVGTATSADQLVTLYQRHRPDVVICDVALMNSSGIQAAERIVAADEDAHILMLSADVSPQTIDAALNAGAHGYIDKRVTSDVLYECVERAFEGGPVFDATTQTAVNASLLGRRNKNGASDPEITKQELRVLQLAAAGLTYRQIGAEMALSWRTVKTYTYRAISKMDVPNRTAAVSRAMQLGWIS